MSRKNGVRRRTSGESDARRAASDDTPRDAPSLPATRNPWVRAGEASVTRAVACLKFMMCLACALREAVCTVDVGRRRSMRFLDDDFLFMRDDDERFESDEILLEFSADSRQRSKVSVRPGDAGLGTSLRPRLVSPTVQSIRWGPWSRGRVVEFGRSIEIQSIEIRAPLLLLDTYAGRRT